ncbi:nucleotide-binding alpha-beta plait domain-containing protein [Tanacetum coccineum]
MLHKYSACQYILDEDTLQLNNPCMTMVTDSKQGGEGEEQDDGDANERRKNVPRITVVNYFFTNFPPEWNEGNLREVFAEFGEIKQDLEWELQT